MYLTDKAQLKKLGFILLLLAFCPLLQAKIYRSTAPDGTVVFSDMDSAGARSVTLPPVSSYQQTVRERPSPSVKPKSVKKLTYQSLVFTNLQNDATVRNNNAVPFIVQAKLVPELHEGDQAQLLLDSKVVAVNSGSDANLVFTLQGVNRGAHQLLVEIVRGKARQVVRSSRAITVYFQQNSVRRLLSEQDEEEEKVG